MLILFSKNTHDCDIKVDPCYKAAVQLANSSKTSKGSHLAYVLPFDLIHVHVERQNCLWSLKMVLVANL